MKIADVKINTDRRPLNMSKVQELADSIKDIGLINPITVDRESILIAGLHRLEACKLLEWVDIECNVVDLDGLKAELAEIDENLVRNELHYIERGECLSRRKRIYELLHPEAKAKVAGAIASNAAQGKRHASDIMSFASDAASKIGVSARTVQREIQIAEKLTHEIKELIKENDISKTDAIKLSKLEPLQQTKIAEKMSEGAKSFVEARRRVTKDTVKEIAPIEGKYKVFYADPPWHYGNSGLDDYGHAERHYPTMTIDELCQMPIKEKAEDNAVLFLWVTSPLLEECFPVIKAWGFKYKTSFVWDKVKHNMGHYNSVRHEFLLIATKGSCTPETVKLFDSVQEIERTGTHSEKPEEFRNIINILYSHGKKIELFARTKVEGWDTWGNQL